MDNLCIVESTPAIFSDVVIKGGKVYAELLTVVAIEIRVYRKGSYVLADNSNLDNSTVDAAPRLFCGFFLKQHI
jgi:hypothetical protein